MLNSRHVYLGTMAGLGAVAVFVTFAAAVSAASDPQLPDAVQQQDKAAIRALLQQRTDVNTPQGDGTTALHWAVHLNDLDTADRLIRAGANVNRANDYGITPLWLASNNGDAKMAEALLGARANPNAALPSGETVLMRAAWTGDVKVVRLLLTHGAEVNAKEASRGQTALMWAVSERHPDVARILVEAGADVTARSTTGFTPLLFAARVGALDAAKLLLAAGGSANDAVPPKSAPAMPGRKSDGGVGKVVKSTFQGGRTKCEGYFPVCTPTASPDGSALLIATVRGHTHLATYLLAQGADPNGDGGMGYTALHWAVGSWGTEMVGPNGIAQGADEEWDFLPGLPQGAKLDFIKALLAHGADPNARMQKLPPRVGFTKDKWWGVNMDGATPFLLAAQAANLPVLRLLLDAGADPRLGTYEGTTPLMAAASMGRMEDENPVPEGEVLKAVKLALELGNDINAANDMGDTALHAAATNRLNTVVQFLVDHGAKVNARNNRDQTPLTVAELQRQLAGIENVRVHTSTGALLRKLGALN